jgi:hypothetical protein
MIKFFRKIRQKLLSKNKFTKYLLYAIGEIILVVIGILIALQINNQNETKKDKAYETKMLSEINKALDYDLKHFERMIDRLDRLDSVSTTFIDDIHNSKTEFNDTLYDKGYSRWYGLRIGILYQYNPGPFEALKSSGLDKLSNDSLRNSLIEFYDFHFPYNKELVAFTDRQYDEYIDDLEAFLSPPFTEEINGKVEVLKKFPKDLYSNIDFLELLRNIRARAQITKNYLNTHTKRMKKVSAQLKKELSN